MSGALPTLTFPSDANSSAPFTLTEKTWIRWACGYGMEGNVASGFASWRFFQAFGVLDFKLVDGNLTPSEYQIARQMLGEISTLRTAMIAISSSLNVGKAAVYTRNPRELAERRSLLRDWRMQLLGLMQLPPGPDMQAGDGANITI